MAESAKTTLLSQRFRPATAASPFLGFGVGGSQLGPTTWACISPVLGFGIYGISIGPHSLGLHFPGPGIYGVSSVPHSLGLHSPTRGIWDFGITADTASP